MKDWQQKIYFSLFANLTGFLPMFISLEFYTPWDFYTMTHNHDQRPRSRPIDQNQDHVYDQWSLTLPNTWPTCEFKIVKSWQFFTPAMFISCGSPVLWIKICVAVYFPSCFCYKYVYLSTFATFPSFVHKFIHISFTRINGNLVVWSICNNSN